MTDISLPRTAGRVGLAAGAAAFLAFGLAAPAAAEPETYDRSTLAQYQGHAESGETVRMDGSSIGTNLFRLQVEGGGELIAYCIDIDTGIRTNAWYLEDQWANYPGQGDFAEPGKVHWILQNSYPRVSAGELAEAAGVDSSRFGDSEALAATQAAIWYFSNGAELTANDPGGIKGAYDYLIEAAEELPQEPGPSLNVSGDSTTGQAGETVGAFEISTTAAELQLELTAPEGVELVDIETGEAVETVGDGDTVGFSVPADADAGEASFGLSATSTVEQGRLFKGKDPNKPTQTLITAEDSDVTVSAGAGVEWSESDEPEPEPTPEPTEPEETDEPDPKPTPTDEPEDDKPAPEDDEPSLPVTGGALVGLVAAGVAALGAGGSAIYLTRKRKASALDSDEG